jgi:hypothetical protein
MTMPTTDLWAATLSMLLIHEESGCRQSALHAARMLDRISDMDIDDETRQLCERASLRLECKEKHPACAY